MQGVVVGKGCEWTYYNFKLCSRVNICLAYTNLENNPRTRGLQFFRLELLLMTLGIVAIRDIVAIPTVAWLYFNIFNDYLSFMKIKLNCILMIFIHTVSLPHMECGVSNIHIMPYDHPICCGSVCCSCCMLVCTIHMYDREYERE